MIFQLIKPIRWVVAIRSAKVACLRGGLVMLAAILLGAFTVLGLGLLPANRHFEETPDGIEIFVYSDSAHSEIVFPCVTPQLNWKTIFNKKFFPAESLQHSHIGIGWGERDFFIETPTWEDIKISTTIRAMFWPTRSAIKATYQPKPVAGPCVRSVKISKQQYQKLIAYALNNLRGKENLQQIKGASHGANSRFFESRGKYHMFWTCNAWVGQGLKQAEIRVGQYTPLPKTVFWWL